MLYDLFIDASFWISIFITMYSLYYFVSNLVIENCDDIVDLGDIIFIMLLTIFILIFYHASKTSSIVALQFIKAGIVSILTTFYCKFRYGVKFKNGFLAMLIYYSVAIVVENIILVIHTTFSTPNINEFVIVLYNLLLSMTMLLFTKTKVYKEFDTMCMYENSNAYLTTNYILLLTSIILAGVNAINEDVPSLTIYIKFGLSFAILIVFIVGSKVYNKFIFLREENKLLAASLDSIEKTINEERMMNHEYKNQVMFVNSMIEKDSAAMPYVKNLIYEENETLTYLNELNYLKCLPIRIFITSKFKEFTRDYPNIKIGALVLRSTASAPFQNLSTKQIQDITKILGVFLDNAQQAAINTIDKNVDVFISYEADYVEFSIFNTFDEINDDLKTTKGGRHGHGLKLVEKIIAEEERFEKTTEIDSEKRVFKQILIVDVEK